jgi:hypothetical protein
MSIASFLTAIRDGNAAAVPPRAPIDDREWRAASDVIETCDFVARTELAYHAPRLVPEVARWAAERLYGACQFLVYREVEADEVREGCAVPCLATGAISPDVCYSADLVLRYLPDVFALAQGIAREDPLIDGLRNLAREWPLSSVGIPEVGEVDVSGFIRHPGLRRLYADRIIERNDRSRLGDAAVVAAVREAIGAYPGLAPSIWAALAPATGEVMEERHV